LLASAAGAQAIVATPRHADGIYAAGEKIEWQISGSGVTEVRYAVIRNGFSLLASGTLPLTSGSGELETSLSEPGTVLVKLVSTAKDKDPGVLLGAAVEPFKIQPSSPCPADFDAFWKSKIEELNTIPVNPVVEQGESKDPAVDYVKVRLDNIGGTHVYGQLAKPKGKGKYPAMLIFQGAGVYGLTKSTVVLRAREGWLALNIMAHDLPIDEPDAYYQQLEATTLHGYMTFGNDDPDKSYFLRMFLGCCRAASYLASRPDWDGRVLVATGASQGGFQSLATAALYPGITAALVDVPAGSDNAGPSVGHSVSFPWFGPGKDSAGRPRDARKVAETNGYYDAVNFAPRIKCPVLMGVGLIDQTCPPTGVLTTYNQVPGKKEIVIMREAGHSSKGNTHAAYVARWTAWLNALKQGVLVPAK
jgi:cephalosporin-C deacetylase-like acetyl esterase